MEVKNDQVLLSKPQKTIGPDDEEIKVETVWAKLLDKDFQDCELREVPPQYEGKLFLINPIFSPEECKRLIQSGEQIGFGKTNYNKAYRGNLRLISKDESLAEAVWKRLQPVVPSTVEDDGSTWDAIGLNEVWRCAKYHPTDQFKGHYDACFAKSKNLTSMFTVNIYVNGGFQGGSTRFYPKHDRKNPDLAVVPEAGLGCVFRQPPGEDLYHDGEALGSDVKYLWRSDIMYQRRGEKEMDSYTEKFACEQISDFSGRKDITDEKIALVKRILDPSDDMDGEPIDKQRFIVGMKTFYPILLNQDTTPEHFFKMINTKNERLEQKELQE